MLLLGDTRLAKRLYKLSGELVKKVSTDAWLMRMKYVGDDKMLCYIGNEMDDKNAHQLRTIDLNTGEGFNASCPLMKSRQNICIG